MKSVELIIAAAETTHHTSLLFINLTPEVDSAPAPPALNQVWSQKSRPTSCIVNYV